MSTQRRVGVAVDFSVGSKKAVSWAVDNLVREGDHLILLNVVPRKAQPEPISEEAKLIESKGSPFIRLSELEQPDVQLKYGITVDMNTLEIARIAVDQKKIDVMMKVYWGDPREKLCEAIENIPLNCLVVGSRGLGSLQRMVMTSVSNHVVNNGTCPVIVVKHHN